MPESKKLSKLIDEFIFYSCLLRERDGLRNKTGTQIVNFESRKNYLGELIDQKFEELRCSCKKHKLKEWKESLSLFEQVMESKKKEYPLFEGKNEFYSSEENARKGIQEIKEILFRRGDEIQKRMLEIIYENDSEKD